MPQEDVTEDTSPQQHSENINLSRRKPLEEPQLISAGQGYPVKNCHDREKGGMTGALQNRREKIKSLCCPARAAAWDPKDRGGSETADSSPPWLAA